MQNCPYKVNSCDYELCTILSIISATPSKVDQDKDPMVSICTNQTVRFNRVTLTLAKPEELTIPNVPSMCQCVIRPTGKKEVSVKPLDIRLQAQSYGARSCKGTNLKVSLQCFQGHLSRQLAQNASYSLVLVKVYYMQSFSSLTKRLVHFSNHLSFCLCSWRAVMLRSKIWSVVARKCGTATRICTPVAGQTKSLWRYHTSRPTRIPRPCGLRCRKVRESHRLVEKCGIWMKKKWLENEARLNKTGNNWLAPELCSRDSSVTQVA
jgi:hypothetical protein